MKRKIYIILFIGFVILAGLAAYKLISDQVDYQTAADYYQSFADTWVQHNTPDETKDTPEDVKMEETSVSESVSASLTEASSATASSGETKVQGDTVSPAESVLSSETTVPIQIKARTETVAPSQTALSSDAAGPVETETVSDTVSAAETAAPYGTASPVEAAAPSETAVQADAESVSEQKIQSDSGSELSDEAEIRRETPGTNEAPTPVETDALVEEITPTETESSPETVETITATDSGNPEASHVAAEQPEESSPSADSLLPFKKVVVPKTTGKSKPAEYAHTTEQPPISVDFEKLRLMNPEIVGWIYCEDTPINYPVLQGSDNDKYLKTQPDGKTSRSGSVFIDCFCEPDFSSDNTLMYGHNRRNGMFACLPKYANQSYYEAHPVMWLLTPGGNYRVDLFASFFVLANGWVYEINLYPENLRNEFLDRCLASSDFKTEVDPRSGVGILTLSTCHYNGVENARYVVLGTLIPSE